MKELVSFVRVPSRRRPMHAIAYVKLRKYRGGHHRMVNCLTMSPSLPVIPPSLDRAEAEPGFFSKIFQNLRLSSAASLVSVWVMKGTGRQLTGRCEHLTIGLKQL